MPASDLVVKAKSVLDRFWFEIRSQGEEGLLQDWLEDLELAEQIRAAVNSTEKTYRYVLPTQLIAKIADPALDCRCVQAQRGGRGAFDARTVAHKIVVPFDQANERVLGGSPEPYVNNPLRVLEITMSHVGNKKKPSEWERLCLILDKVETAQEPTFTELVFKQTLTELYRRLSTVRVVYPIPQRTSLAGC